MSALELMARVGKMGVFEVEGMRVIVKILDARKVFGRLDYHVVPVLGAGAAWVAANRVGEYVEGGAL